MLEPEDVRRHLVIWGARVHHVAAMRADGEGRPRFVVYLEESSGLRDAAAEVLLTMPGVLDTESPGYARALLYVTLAP